MYGIQLPGYQITGLIGKGAMGVVYRGRHLATGDDVAIKTLHSPDPSMHRALANEWEVLLRIQHPFLVNERDLITLNDRSFLVMEYVESVTMTRWLEHVDEATRKEGAGMLIDQVCTVLQYLHSQNPPVIVRDLKPDNILLTPQGTIKLIDFGIARTVTANSHTELALKGFATAAYAPLEQYSSRSSTGPASDVYSLGATAFHLLSGEAPPSAVDLVSQTVSVQQMLLDRRVDPVWAALVNMAMKSKAADRISLNDFHQRIPGKPDGRPVGKPTESLLSWIMRLLKGK